MIMCLNHLESLANSNHMLPGHVSGPPAQPLDVLSVLRAWVLPCFGWTVVIVLVILVAAWLFRPFALPNCYSKSEAKALRIKWPEPAPQSRKGNRYIESSQTVSAWDLPQPWKVLVLRLSNVGVHYVAKKMRLSTRKRKEGHETKERPRQKEERPLVLHSACALAVQGSKGNCGLKCVCWRKVRFFLSLARHRKAMRSHAVLQQPHLWVPRYA